MGQGICVQTVAYHTAVEIVRGKRPKEHRTNLANAPSPDLGHEAWPEVDGQVQTHHIFIDVRVSTDVDIERG